MNDRKIDAHVEVTEKTRVPLGFAFSIAGFFMSFLVGLTAWGIRTESKADSAIEKARALETDIKEIRNDVSKVHDSQVRIEAAMGLKPDLFYKSKSSTQK